MIADTETTGLPNHKKRLENQPDIIQLYYRIYEIGVDKEMILKKEYNQYFNTDMEIEKWAFKAHWITKKDLKDKPLIKDYLEDIIEDIEDVSYIIWHNISFDIKMLNLAFDKHNQNYSARLKNQLCTMQDTINICKLRWKWPWYKKPSLVEAYKYIYWEIFKWAHNAKNDVLATEAIFMYLVQEWVYEL